MVQFSLRVDRARTAREIHQRVLKIDERVLQGSSSSVMDRCQETVRNGNALSSQVGRKPTDDPDAVDVAENLIQLHRKHQEHQRISTHLHFQFYCAWKQLCREEAEQLNQLLRDNPPPVITPLVKSNPLDDAILVVEINETTARRQIIDTHTAYVDWVTPKMEASRTEYQQAMDRRTAAEAARRLAHQALELEAVKLAADQNAVRAAALRRIHEDEAEAQALRAAEQLRQEQLQRRAADEQRQRDEESRRALHAAEREREAKVRELQRQEEEVRRRVAQHDAQQAAERQRQAEEARIYAEHLAAEEQLLKDKLQRSERLAHEKKLQETNMLLEHITAEEALLKSRMEAKRIHEEEEAKGQNERRLQEQRQLMEHIAAEEALLRSRMDDRHVRAQQAAAVAQHQRDVQLESYATKERELQQKILEKERQQQLAAEAERKRTAELLRAEENRLRVAQERREAHRVVVQQQAELEREYERQRQLQHLRDEENRLLALQANRQSHIAAPLPPPPGYDSVAPPTVVHPYWAGHVQQGQPYVVPQTFATAPPTQWHY